jgi:hypothetical protein
MSDTVEVDLDMDEAYPVYYVRQPSSYTLKTTQIPREVYDEWARVIGQYHRVQDEMAAYYCITYNGEHDFVTTPGIHGPRTYCTYCNTDKEEPSA